MFRRKGKVVAAVAVAVALTLSGCTGSDSGGSGTASGGKLTITNLLSPSSYNPAQGAEWDNFSAYWQAVYDTLLYQADDGTIKPWLATRWSYNDAKTVLTLTLRDGVTFTDGQKLTADAAKQSLEHFRDGTSSYASWLAGTTYTAPDDKTLVITLKAPDPSFLSYLAKAAGIVASPSTWSNPDAATHPVGSGPYILDTAATVPGTTYVYTANKKYWNKDAVHYSSLAINLVASPTAALNAMTAGETNFAPVIDVTTIPQLEANRWNVKYNMHVWQGFQLFDRDGQLNKALADVRVRQAINYALDRPALLKALVAGHGEATTQVFAETSAAYDAKLDDYYPYNPDKAKKLLADAGYADGLTLHMPQNPGDATTYTVIAQQLADIGVTVKYDTAAGGTGDFNAVIEGKYPANWSGMGEGSDWDVIQLVVAPTATYNPFHTTNDTVNGLMATIQTGSQKEADAAAKKLNTYLVEQAWFAPAFRQKSYFGSDANTTFTMPAYNSFPSLFSIKPKNG